MKFAMLTTFFGPHSFGGDAAFVDRLSRALARHGHEVHVIYCRDAFETVKGDQTPRPYEAPPGVTIHPLSSPFGPLSPLATHQTGLPHFKHKAIRSLLRSIRPDVVHFHNLSLIGGPGLLAVPAPGAVKFMTRTSTGWFARCTFSGSLTMASARRKNASAVASRVRVRLSSGGKRRCSRSRLAISTP